MAAERSAVTPTPGLRQMRAVLVCEKGFRGSWPRAARAQGGVSGRPGAPSIHFDGYSMPSRVSPARETRLARTNRRAGKSFHEIRRRPRGQKDSGSLNTPNASGDGLSFRSPSDSRRFHEISGMSRRASARHAGRRRQWSGEGKGPEKARGWGRQGDRDTYPL